MAATEGYAAPETLRVFSHARDLLADGGTLPQQMTVLWGVYLAHSMRSENIAAREVAQRCLALAAEHEHIGMSALANRFVGQTLWIMGSFVDSRLHLERTLELCAANPETIISYRKFGADDEVCALSALSRTLWTLGYPEQAAAVSGRALARARSMGLAFTTAFALDGEAFLGALGSDPRRAAFHADEAMAHSIEHSFADYEQRARFIQGALLAQSGDPQQGIELMRGAMTTIERTNGVNRRTLYLGHSAAAHASLGQPEIGLELIDEAIQTVNKIDERFFEAELYRIRGEILLTLGRRGEAEAELRQALTIAQQQHARWWELRAASSPCQPLAPRGQIPGGLFAPATGLCVVRRGFRHSIFERCQSAPGRAKGPIRTRKLKHAAGELVICHFPKQVPIADIAFSAAPLEVRSYRSSFRLSCRLEAMYGGARSSSCLFERCPKKRRRTAGTKSL